MPYSAYKLFINGLELSCMRSIYLVVGLVLSLLVLFWALLFVLGMEVFLLPLKLVLVFVGDSSVSLLLRGERLLSFEGLIFVVLLLGIRIGWDLLLVFLLLILLLLVLLLLPSGIDEGEEGGLQDRDAVDEEALLLLF